MQKTGTLQKPQTIQYRRLGLRKGIRKYWIPPSKPSIPARMRNP